MAEDNSDNPNKMELVMSAESEALHRELRQMRAAIRAVVARHEAIEYELDSLGDNPIPTDEVEWRLWTELGNLCPLCANHMDDGLGEAESWELGVHEGNDFSIVQNPDTDTTMSIRRKWIITTTIGRMDSGQLFTIVDPENT